MSYVPYLQPPINLGIIVQGEIPDPLIHTFTDESGAPVNLTGYTAQWSQQAARNAVITLTPTVSDAGTGQVTVTWNNLAFGTPGHYVADLWVYNGSNQFAAQFRFNVVPAVAVPS